MRLTALANHKLDCTARFITMTTRLFFVFYQTRRKFARIGATTSVIGKESYLMTSFSSTRRGTDSPLTEIGIKNKHQTRRHRAFITLIQVVWNRDSPISLWRTSKSHKKLETFWVSLASRIEETCFPCRVTTVPVDLNTIGIARNSGVS